MQNQPLRSTQFVIPPCVAAMTLPAKLRHKQAHHAMHQPVSGSQLHWLDVVDRVRFRVCVQVFRCLHKMAPEYLSTYCQPVSGISGRRHLRPADRGHLDFTRVKLPSYGGRSFAYAGPSNWNSLPAYLRDSSLSLSSFKHHLKTFLFSFY